MNHHGVLLYLLTPWSRVLLEKLTGSAASHEIPRIFGTRRFLTVLTSARHLSLSWANSIQSPQPPPTSRRSIVKTTNTYIFYSPHHFIMLTSYPFQYYSYFFVYVSEVRSLFETFWTEIWLLYAREQDVFHTSTQHNFLQLIFPKPSLFQDISKYRSRSGDQQPC